MSASAARRPAGVRVTVPATSANLGPGFDSLGLALAWYDQVDVRVADAGVSVEVSGVGADTVPRDAQHLVVKAMHATFEALGVAAPGLSLRCRNTIPHGRGLGSSAAAIVAGVLAATALSDGDSPDPPDPLALAAELERHPDNVAACLLGGATVAWVDGGHARAKRLDVHPDIRAVLLVPEAVLATEHARALLPASVAHSDAARNAGRAALLVAALTGDPPLLLDATADLLHQQYRRAGMPGTLDLVEALRADRWAAVVSGAGPSVLVLSASDDLPPAPAGWTRQATPIERRGASVLALPTENAHEGYDTVAIGHED